MKVFISHSSRDKKFVRTLKLDLNENGIETFVDEDELELGDSLKERLEAAIDDSSHFLIVLSPSSVKSDWVNFELKQASSLFKKSLLKKIIPVKYRDCSIPEELQSLLYADLSEEIVITEGEKVRFISEGYSKFVIALVKTLRASDRKLTNADKKELKNDVGESERQFENSKIQSFKTNHKIIKYRDVEALQFYREKVLSKRISKKGNFKDINPVILPPIYKQVFPLIKIGDVITFSKLNNSTYNGHFAGFRLSGMGITLPPIIRKGIQLMPGRYCNFEVDVKEKRFIVLDY